MLAERAVCTSVQGLGIEHTNGKLFAPLDLSHGTGREGKHMVKPAMTRAVQAHVSTTQPVRQYADGALL